jgi:uncharacterized membrane protein
MYCQTMESNQGYSASEGSSRTIRWAVAAIVALVGFWAVTFAIFVATRFLEPAGNFGLPLLFLGFNPFGFVLAFVILFAFLSVVAWLLHTPSSSRGFGLDNLKQRYPKGEITNEQFEQMARDLVQH